MTVTIRTQGTHTVTRADGSVATVTFDEERIYAEEPAVIEPPEPPEEIIDPPEPSPGLRRVTVSLLGADHVFEEEHGTDLGDYIDPQGRFVQHCISTSCATLPGLYVLFRPDADGEREEVVFELGEIWPSQAAANLGAYTATIDCYDEEAPVVVAVSHHNWFGRWRWQSAPRPVVNSVADLIAAGLLPHYDAAVGGGYTQPSTPCVYAGPMDLAGITPYMPQTGGRDDIGLVTECQGDYLCTRSPAALSSLLAQLEGSGTLTWHYRDETTGAPLDTEQYPRASSFNQWESDPYIPWAVTEGGDTGIELDTSHEPDLAYVPFLLTGDPYALEEMQFAVTYNVIKQNPAYRGSYNITGALRAHAWALRTMAHAAKATPAVVPRWLLPQAYFRRMLDGNRDFVARDYATNAAAPFPGLSVMSDGAGSPAESNIPEGCSNAPWWEDYEMTVQGHVVEMGFDDWRPSFEWKIRNIVDRCSGTSGWNRSWAFPYKMAVRPASGAPCVADWADAWSLNLALGVVTDTDELQGDMSYPQQGAAALALAKGLDIAGAADAHEWLAGEIARLSTAQSFVYARWSIA